LGQLLARSSPLYTYPCSPCIRAAIRKSLKNRDTIGGNADKRLANAESFSRRRPRTAALKSGRSSKLRTQTALSIGGGWFRPGRLVRTRAAGSEKSHAGTGEPPRRLPRKLWSCTTCKLQCKKAPLCANPGVVSSLLRLETSTRHGYFTPRRIRSITGATVSAFCSGIRDRGSALAFRCSLVKSSG